MIRAHRYIVRAYIVRESEAVLPADSAPLTASKARALADSLRARRHTVRSVEVVETTAAGEVLVTYDHESGRLKRAA